MLRPHASDDVRARALAAIDEGRSVGDVAAFFQNDPSTIRRWIRQRTATGSHRRRPRPGRPPLIAPEQYPALCAQVAAQPDAILAEQVETWAASHGVRVSLSTMSLALRRAGLTRKKRP
jgi:transposase